jgi:hypothetical protein
MSTAANYLGMTLDGTPSTGNATLLAALDEDITEMQRFIACLKG